MISTDAFYGKNINKAINLLIKNEMIFNCSNYGVEKYNGINTTYCHISVVSSVDKELKKYLQCKDELVGLSGVR